MENSQKSRDAHIIVSTLKHFCDAYEHERMTPLTKLSSPMISPITAEDVIEKEEAVFCDQLTALGIIRTIFTLIKVALKGKKYGFRPRLMGYIEYV